MTKVSTRIDATPRQREVIRRLAEGEALYCVRYLSTATVSYRWRNGSRVHANTMKALKARGFVRLGTCERLGVLVMLTDRGHAAYASLAAQGEVT